MNASFRKNLEPEVEFLELMVAQHKHTREMLDDWLTREPWSYGSIDSADYMDAALALSQEFIEAMMGEPREFLSKLSHDYLMSNYACDGVCEELWDRYPAPEGE